MTECFGDDAGAERLSLSKFMTISSCAQRRLLSAFGTDVLNGQGASGADQAGARTPAYRPVSSQSEPGLDRFLIMCLLLGLWLFHFVQAPKKSSIKRLTSKAFVILLLVFIFYKAQM